MRTAQQTRSELLAGAGGCGSTPPGRQPFTSFTSSTLPAHLYMRCCALGLAHLALCCSPVAAAAAVCCSASARWRLRCRDPSPALAADTIPTSAAPHHER